MIKITFMFKKSDSGQGVGRMSTAHRPTWVSAVGGSGLRDGATSAPTYQKCSKDMPAHTKLKYRQIGQDAPEELLQARKHNEEESEEVPRIQEAPSQEDNDEDLDFENLDADTDIEEDADQVSDEEDEDDEEAELLRELEKIKREREEQKVREAAKRDQEILSHNPLLNLQQDEGFIVKRRWDDDVVFKNQAKGVESKPKKRFINDTTRSDFHRKFMDKYIV